MGGGGVTTLPSLIPELKSLFNKVAGLKATLKETLTQRFSCEYYEIFKNIFFEEHLRTAAFGKAATELIFQISF